MIGSDVLAGKLAKEYPTDKGFKGLLVQSNGDNVFIHLKFDGQLKNTLKDSVGKDVILMGNLRYPGKEAKNKTPVLQISGKFNGGGSITKHGRMVRDAELAVSKQGKQYAKFTIAVDDGYGQNKETDFIFCMLAGNDRDRNPAVTLAEKGAKGRQIAVHGRLGYLKNGNGSEPSPFLSVDSYEFLGAASAKKDATGKDEEDWASLGDAISIDDSDDVPF